MSDPVRDALDRFARTPLHARLGLTARSDASGAATVELPHDEGLDSLHGGTHTGVVATLADATLTLAMSTMLEPGERVTTTQLSVSIMAPPGVEALRADAEVSRRGRRRAFGRCRVLAGDRCVAEAQSVGYITRG